MSVEDEAYVAAELLTEHHEGRIVFDVRNLPGGWVQVRGRLTTGD